MTEIILLSTGLPDLLPMRDRSPGIHVSDVIKDLCVRLSHYDESTQLDRTRKELGKAFEWALIERYKLQFPDRFCSLGEIEMDGLFYTMDLFDSVSGRPHEFKFTFRSSGDDLDIGSVAPKEHAINSAKFWRDRTQLKAYMYGVDSKEGVLELCHVRGDYKSFRVVHNQWLLRCERAELEANWTNLLRHRDKMLEREWYECQ